MAFGRELIVDVHNCTSSAPFTREGISAFCDELCRELRMEKADLHFWDYKDDPEEYEKAPAHLRGISAIQFITTSNITIHALDKMRHVYFNIFSCRDFNVAMVRVFIEIWTKGDVVSVKNIIRR